MSEEMLLKIFEESDCSIEIALQWVIMNAKNSLSNVNEFFTDQLVFGKNPRLPNILCNRLPALEDSSESKIVASN